MKRIAIFSVLIFVFLCGVVAAETFDTAGKMSEAGITFNAKDSFSLSGDYKTNVLVNINEYELEQVTGKSEFTGYGEIEKVPEVEYDLITFQECKEVSTGYVGKEGNYIVPSMSFSVLLSPTAELKEVRLKSTKSQEMKLKLPKFIPARVGGADSYLAEDSEVKGYYPGKTYQVIERREPNGAKSIVFSLYPIQYDAKSHSGNLYYNYEFEIIYTEPTLKNAYMFCLASIPLIVVLFYLIRKKRAKIGGKKQKNVYTPKSNDDLGGEKQK